MDLFASFDFYFSNFSFLVKITWIFGWFWMVFFFLGNFKWCLKNISFIFMMISKWFMNSVLKKMFVSCFIIFLGCKLWGLIPYVFGMTTQIVITLLISLILWFFIILSSMKFSVLKFFSHLVPFGSPKILVPFLFSIEVLSQFLRPMALALRLAMKMTTGHVFIGLIAMGLQNLFFSFSFLFFILILILIFYLIFELMICLMQAFVFSLLLSVWSME